MSDRSGLVADGNVAIKKGTEMAIIRQAEEYEPGKLLNSETG